VTSHHYLNSAAAPKIQEKNSKIKKLLGGGGSGWNGEMSSSKMHVNKFRRNVFNADSEVDVKITSECQGDCM